MQSIILLTLLQRLWQDCLLVNATDLHSIECYDPSAGTGTLLMALAHKLEKISVRFLLRIFHSEVIKC